MTNFLSVLDILEKRNASLAFMLTTSHPAPYSTHARCKEFLFPQDKDVLYFMGGFSEECIDQGIKWLNEKRDRFIIVIEKTLEDVAFVLHYENIQEILVHPRFFLHYDLQQFLNQELLKTVWMTCFLKSEQVFANGDDDTSKRAFCMAVKRAEDAVHCLASDWMDFGVAVAKNCYSLALFIKECKKANALKGVMRGIPAVVVGSGSTVESQMSVLKEYEHQVLILSAGSALKKLTSQSIKAQMGAYVDPFADEKLLQQDVSFDGACFFSVRTNASLVKHIRGEKLFFRDQSGHLLEDYFFLLEKDTSELGFWGWNVGNVLVKWALEMGCHPVIMMGMDMVYEPSDGILKPNEEWVTPVETQVSRKDLLMGKDFFEELAKEYPHQEILNAAPSGLTINGIKTIDLCEALTMYSQSMDYEGLVHQKIELLEDHDQNKALIQEKILGLYESMLRSEALIEGIIKKIEGIIGPSSLVEKRIALEEIELEEELMYRLILEPLWQRMRWVILRERCSLISDPEGILMKYLLMRKAIAQHLELMKTMMKEYGEYASVFV